LGKDQPKRRQKQTKFEDHFSELAWEYSRYRPQYPQDLIRYLADIAPERNLAWDCGTGNGQAAVQLAGHFQRVYATDASPEQIAQATKHSRVEFKVEHAEAVSLATNSVDLVTVAVAVHWFNLDEFYREVKRVLKPTGVLAVWTYHLPQVEAGIFQVIWTYYREVLGKYWPDRIRYVDEKYKTLPFPFEEFTPPHFELHAEWDLNQLVGYLSSWSAAFKFMEKHRSYPMDVILDDLRSAWGEADSRRELRWPLFIRVGRNT
jgi:ubiquinone/menaquinone biosynthesis C-methylase UbiE